MTTTITWTRIEDGLPDVDSNILLGLSSGFSCEGFLDDQEWRDVCGMPIDPLCVETAKRAQAGLMRAYDRHTTTGRWGFDGPALQDMPDAIDLYEQMLELSTPMQMQAAMRETINRMNGGMTL